MKNLKSIFLIVAIAIAVFSIAISVQAEPQKKSDKVSISDNIDLTIDQQNQRIRDTLARVELKRVKRLSFYQLLMLLKEHLPNKVECEYDKKFYPEQEFLVKQAEMIDLVDSSLDTVMRVGLSCFRCNKVFVRNRVSLQWYIKDGKLRIYNSRAKAKPKNKKNTLIPELYKKEALDETPVKKPIKKAVFKVKKFPKELIKEAQSNEEIEKKLKSTCIEHGAKISFDDLKSVFKDKLGLKLEFKFFPSRENILQEKFEIGKGKSSAYDLMNDLICSYNKSIGYYGVESGDDEGLKAVIWNGRIIILSVSYADRYFHTKSYDVSDLLENKNLDCIPDHLREFFISSYLEDEVYDCSKSKHALISVITDLVASEDWRTHGGNHIIFVHEQTLYVSAKPEVIKQVDQVIKKLKSNLRPHISAMIYIAEFSDEQIAKMSMNGPDSNDAKKIMQKYCKKIPCNYIAKGKMCKEIRIFATQRATSKEKSSQETGSIQAISLYINSITGRKDTVSVKFREIKTQCNFEVISTSPKSEVCTERVNSIAFANAKTKIGEPALLHMYKSKGKNIVIFVKVFK